MTTISSLSSLQSHLSSSTPHYGDMVFWMLSGAEFNLPTLETAWANAGLPKEVLPHAQTPEKALHQAIRWANSGKNRNLVRKIAENNEKMFFGIVSESADEATVALDYQHNTTLTLEKVTGTLTVSGAQSDLADTIVQKFNHFVVTNPATDLMSTIVKTLKLMKAVTLRETGGFYWVPATHAAMLRNLQSVVALFGSSKLSLIPIFETPEAKAELGAAATGTLDAMVTKIREEIATYKEEGARPSTLRRRLEAFNEIRATADMYKTLLEISVDDLEEEIKVLESDVAGMLLDIENAA